MLTIKKPVQDNARHIERKLLAVRKDKDYRRELRMVLREARG
jgi:hypothetical protein